MKKILFILAILIGTHYSLAQNLLPDPVTITTSPEAPAPGQTVTLSASSLTANLDKSDISWSVNGQLVSSAFGQKSININLPFGNQVITIELLVKTTEGEKFYAKKTINPSRVILITEAGDSYVPYWYSGKAEVARAGKFKVFAYTEIYSGNKRLQPSELVYKWSVRDEPALESSGVGKSTLNYKLQDEYGDNVPVSVTISPINNDAEYSANTEITPKNPEVYFYLGDEAGNIINQNSIVNNQTVKSRIFSIISEPFFFSTDYLKTKNLEYSWSINGEEQQGLDRSSKLFKLPEGASGTASVDLSIRHVSRIFQEAKRRINIIF